MKATGIIRRIDDLGRGIPKKTRKTMRIQEEESLLKSSTYDFEFCKAMDEIGKGYVL